MKRYERYSLDDNVRERVSDTVNIILDLHDRTEAVKRITNLVENFAQDAYFVGWHKALEKNE